MNPVNVLRGIVERNRYERKVLAELGAGQPDRPGEGPVADIIRGTRYPRAEEKACPLCGQYREPRRLRARFGMIAMVSECGECRLAYQTPMPSPEATLAYMDALWESRAGYMGNEPSLGRARVEFEYLRQQSPKPGKLLDFGAGVGAFVRVALDNGWDAHGVERSPKAIERAKTENHVALTSDIVGEGYDVVTLWDVIEHLRQPAETVVQLKGVLRPGGVLIVETGNWESALRLATRDRWPLYQMDHHYYFSPPSLKVYLQRCGFGHFTLLPRPPDRPRLQSIVNPLSWLRQSLAYGFAEVAWPEHGCHSLIIASVWS